MKKENYLSPEVEVIDIAFEGCFALSELTNDPSDLEYENW